MALRLAEVWVLQSLWLLPCILVLALTLRARAHKRLTQHIGSKTFPLLANSASKRRQKIKLILQTLTLALMVLALARPQKVGGSRQKVRRGGIEMMILFDVSRSMLAEDVQPNRLAFAKKEVIRLLDMNSGNKVGLVAFAGSSILLSPMTTDMSALKMFLSSLTTDSVSTQGTEFKRALKRAKEAFERGGERKNGESTVTRTILIVSDGEDHEEGAVKVAEELVKEGIYIFSLAIGTEKGASIPVKDRSGRVRSYYKSKKGKVVLTKTKGTILRELAQKGRGSFRHVKYGGTAIADLYKDLQKLEKADIEGEELVEYNERYQWVLALALLLAVLEISLNERQAVGRIWRGRFEIAEN